MAHDEDHGMTIPNQLSLEALMAEDGQPVSAGLPPPLRAAHEQIVAGADLVAQSRERRERMHRIMAQITEHETRLLELHQELQHVVRESLRSPGA